MSRTIFEVIRIYDYLKIRKHTANCFILTEVLSSLSIKFKVDVTEFKITSLLGKKCLHLYLRLRQVDVVMTLDLGSADWTLSTGQR
jgi:hypothetical protein